MSHPRNKAARTYETIKFKCMGCSMYATFGANGLCQKCLEECVKSEDCGG